MLIKAVFVLFYQKMEQGQKPGKVLFLKIALKFKENWNIESSRKTF